MFESSAAPARTIQVFAAASLATVALGAFVMQQGGLSPSLWLRNAAAWLAAGGLGVFLAHRGWLTGFMAPVALAVIGLSLAGAGQDGVHRWLDLGPIQLNAAALVLPPAIAGFMRERAGLTAPCFVLIAAVLAWQPDRSQLAAFAVAAIILSGARFGWRGALLSGAAAAGAMALCLSRADPLAPVEHVEGIFAMAWAQSPAMSIAMAAGLSATAASPLLLWRVAGLRWPAAALSCYFAVSAAAWLIGAYPVPLAGYGVSFVLGWWAGVAALCGVASRPAQIPD